MIGSLATLLLCQLLGEAAARGLGLPVPGPVLGMVLLFILLLLRGEEADAAGTPLGSTVDALLGNLGLLFIPAAVGVVVYLPVLARDWAPISCAILGGTLAAIAATGMLAQALLRRWG